jgi:excisionase family DNA binding protein
VTAPAQPLAYTDADVASLLHVSKRTVYRLRKSGALRAVHIGRAVRIPADSLKQLLECTGHTETEKEPISGTSDSG